MNQCSEPESTLSSSLCTCAPCAVRRGPPHLQTDGRTDHEKVLRVHFALFSWRAIPLLLLRPISLFSSACAVTCGPLRPPSDSLTLFDRDRIDKVARSRPSCISSMPAGDYVCIRCSSKRQQFEIDTEKRLQRTSRLAGSLAITTYGVAVACLQGAQIYPARHLPTRPPATEFSTLFSITHHTYIHTETQSSMIDDHDHQRELTSACAITSVARAKLINTCRLQRGICDLTGRAGDS